MAGARKGERWERERRAGTGCFRVLIPQKASGLTFHMCFSAQLVRSRAYSGLKYVARGCMDGKTLRDTANIAVPKEGIHCH